ncbi:hypothetical protein BKA65DRAFT_198095 [Rhexocercosporidium sp. MPI-PUGE-AT-0058]|nr:hypothetical protein BKA65DRAFT_198095 [Rhexocercosporidium sp. MPI-PUGE-AT-0058]
MESSAFILPPALSTLKTFHCFNDLPLELRQHIWYLCLPGPRIHRIGWTAPKRTARSSCISPEIMLVCKEARKEALHHLKRLSLPSILLDRPPSTQPGYNSRCYFNPAIDTLFLTAPCHPLQSISPWLRNWLKGSENTDFSLVHHLAIDREWLNQTSALSRFEMEIGELVRLFGHVEIVHVVSLNNHWSMRPWTMWRGCGRVPENMRAEFTWVDMEEVRSRPRGRYTCIWSDWGDNTVMAQAGTDILSLDGNEALARLGEVVQKLADERAKYPSGWTMPNVQLDFVRYDRAKRQEKPGPAPEEKRVTFGMEKFGALFPTFLSINRVKGWMGRS